MHADNDSTPMHRFFAGITEQTFHAKLGVPDIDLVDLQLQIETGEVMG